MPLEFAIVDDKKFPYQEIAAEASLLQKQGKSATAIARIFKVTPPTVRKAINLKKPPRIVEVGRAPGKIRVPAFRLDRQKLYERVWSEPVWTIAKTWGLSDRGVAKACERASIPVPPRGYWTKLKAGFTPPRVPLPKIAAPLEIVVYVPKGQHTSAEPSEVHEQEGTARGLHRRTRHGQERE